MAPWSDDEEYQITWFGINADEVDQELHDTVMAKIAEYSRGAPVRAKVVFLQRTLHDTLDSVGVFRVGDTLYFAALTNSFMVVMDLHYVKNSIISRYLDLDRIIHLG